MITMTGYVDHIIFRNKDNGYTVFQLTEGKKEHICVGVVDIMQEGEYVEVTGEEVIHPVYDKQIKIHTYEIRVPEDEDSILRYLGSGAIKGIGLKLADRILRKFKKDTLRIIEEEPERLAEVKGISMEKAMAISTQVSEKKDMRQAMMYLQKYSIPTGLALKIYNKYGNDMYQVLESNPYKMADDIDGVGFKIADEIATKIGIQADSDFRIKSGLVYSLQRGALNGHTFLPMDELIRDAKNLLEIQDVEMDKQIMDLVIDKKIIVKDWDQTKAVYLANFYYTELKVAKQLYDLNFQEIRNEKETYAEINRIEKELKIELDEMQKQAIFEAATSGVLILTGGPGTGKTTTINAIIHFFEAQGNVILLAAPTGRAAKRMSEATGYEAQTIHRMLEFTGGMGENDTLSHFEKNEENPLEADVIIIDEMSMVDIFLMGALLKAIPVGTRLILVGDVDQLPSVNPGNVLKDVISSESFQVVMLNKIFRQATESEIITNAHRINKGQPIEFSNKKDFIYIERDNANRIAGVITTLIREKLPKYVHTQQLDVQVLTPTRIGNLGTINLNRTLQEQLNPEKPGKQQKEFGDFIFREGDKVMQIKNNYQISWEKKNSFGHTTAEGMGVFNGDMGVITKINLITELMEVEFDEGKRVRYSFKNLDELELAYAITVHKSQGSEYPAVIIPVLSGPKMLMNRNVLYTAVTRAKSCVCLVGLESTIKNMIENEGEHKRYSSLDLRIEEIQKTRVEH